MSRTSMKFIGELHLGGSESPASKPSPKKRKGCEDAQDTAVDEEVPRPKKGRSSKATGGTKQSKVEAGKQESLDDEAQSSNDPFHDEEGVKKENIG